MDIAQSVEAPQAFTAKILQTLSKHNLIQSMKGRGGGFFFNESQQQISLFDVINVMEGDNLFTQCGFGLKTCDDDHPCPLHEEYKKLIDGFYQILSTQTIEEVAEKVRTGRATISRLIKGEKVVEAK
jgi:Rrf2 family protein